MRYGAVGAGLAALVAMLAACSAPATAPAPVASDGPPSPSAGLDPCGLIDTDQVTQLGLHASARTGSMGCSWSTKFGSTIGVNLEQHAQTVQEFVAEEQKKQLAGNLTVSSWTGQRHQGAALNWGDGHGYGVIITVSPTQITTVIAYDGGGELGRSIPDVLDKVAVMVDRNLPA
jgi:Protein of unknown function (DUF3558)